MQKRKVVAVVLAVTMLIAVSCGRKGTGCPTFSKVTTEQTKVKQG